MRTSIVTVTLSGSIEDKLDAAAAAGFEGVELFAADLEGHAGRLGELRRRSEDLGLALHLYQPFRDVEAVPAARFAANLERAERLFDDLHELGTEKLLVVSSSDPEAVDDDGLAAEQLHEVAERAQARGLRIVYEALSWARHVRDYRHAWRIVQKADHPALGICLDSFHVFAHDLELESIRGIPGDRIFSVQVADAPRRGDRDLLTWSRHDRCWPGDGAFPVHEFAAAVRATGYDGTWALEIFSDVLRATDPFTAARDGLASLRRLGDLGADHRRP